VCFSDVLLEMESNSYVNAYHFSTQQFEELYSGTALQDAVIVGDMLYIAKSSATNPPSALLSVNMTTKETVPVGIDGNVIYSLCAADSTLYGIAVQADEDTKKTVLFSYDTQSMQTRSLLSLADEDTNAIAYVYGTEIYTNIGKDNVFSYNLSDRTTITYTRSASLPVKVSRNANRLVILNRDGSVSWDTADVAAGACRLVSDKRRKLVRILTFCPWSAGKTGHTLHLTLRETLRFLFSVGADSTAAGKRFLIDLYV